MKMKRNILSIALIAFGFSAFGSQVADEAEQDSPVLMTIGDEKVTLAEFERIYRKNNNENSLNRQTPEEYLDLFINFKLKVKEAEALGMDTTAKFINELEGYREQLAKPYLADEETKEEMMKEAYERSKLDINASHILIKLPTNPTPADTLAAWEKIMKVRERILNGESFETVARATSEDASVSRNGGNLGYFTVFSMIYPFESAAYNTPVGEISMPFRTSYGYHIVQVNDRRPAKGQVKIGHIFVRTPEGMTEDEKKEAYQKARMVYDSLQIGADFGEMARKYSDDPSTSRKGGEMPWFGTGRMIPEFENAAFSLEEKGEITKPFKSFYGWHIIKLLDKKGIGTYEEMKPELQDKANRADRREYQTVRFVNKLKQEYGFTEYPGGLDLVLQNVDTTFLKGKWKGGEVLESNEPLMKIGDRTVPAGKFAEYLVKKQSPRRSVNPEPFVRSLYEDFVREQVIAYEDANLANKYPDFRHIYQEYHDGILLFDIMDQKVWSKAVTDTAGLEAFYRQHRNDYMWGERYDAIIVTCRPGADLELVRKAYKKISRGKLDEKDLNQEFCSNDTVDCITLKSVLVEKGVNQAVDAMNGQTGLGPVSSSDSTDTFVILKNVRSPEPKALKEARGQITSDYQNYLEEKWVDELKAKYPVEVNMELLSGIKP
jgi:peptidyl-prolyl cis-trans isomerase SurA